MLFNPDGTPRHFFDRKYPLTPQQESERRDLGLSHIQYQILTDEHRFIVLVAGRRTGKTHALICRAIMEAQSGYRKRVAFVGPSLKLIKKNIWDTLKQAVPPNMIIDKNETELWIKLRYSESTIRLYSGENNGDSIRGSSLDCALIDEAADVPAAAWYYAIRPALADMQGTAILAGTPKPTWFEDIYTQARSGEDPNWSAHHYPSTMGEMIELAEIEEARRQLTDRQFSMEFEADFVNQSLMVYSEFKHEIHVSTKVADRGGTIYMGSDQNVNPYCCVLGQKVREGDQDILEIFDEIILIGGHTALLIEEIKSGNDKLGRPGYFDFKANGWKRLIIMCPDPASKGRHTSAGGKTDVQQFGDAGICVQAPKKTAVRDKINTLQAMFRTADGSSRIRIHPRCKTLIKSLQKLQYAAGSSQPDKGEFDHCCDALAYLVLRHFALKRQEAKVVKLSGW